MTKYIFALLFLGLHMTGAPTPQTLSVLVGYVIGLLLVANLIEAVYIGFRSLYRFW